MRLLVLPLSRATRFPFVRLSSSWSGREHRLLLLVDRSWAGFEVDASHVRHRAAGEREREPQRKPVANLRTNSPNLMGQPLVFLALGPELAPPDAIQQLNSNSRFHCWRPGRHLVRVGRTWLQWHVRLPLEARKLERQFGAGRRVGGSRLAFGLGLGLLPLLGFYVPPLCVLEDQMASTSSGERAGHAREAIGAVGARC